MAENEYDVAILGGGTGGYTAAIRAAQLGKRVALVEQAKLGGTCLHLGCIPTKALLESSNLFHKVHARGAEYGVNGDVTFDATRVASRRDVVVNQLWKGVQSLMKKHRIEVIAGHGKLNDRNTIQVGDQTVRATAVIVATGSRPKGLPGLEFDGRRVINSDHAVLAGDIPKSVAIVGAGAIGVEFATYYRQLDAEVTLLEALPRLVPLEDEEVSKVMLQAFKKAGIDCRVNARVREVRPADDRVMLRLEDDGELEADKLLIAVGRMPNSEDCGLREVGVELDRNGFVKTDEWLRTNVSGIWAIGDVVGGYLLAHAAAHEGVTAVEDIAGQRVHAMEQDLVTRCTYSSPEIASVGLTEAQAREQGHEVKSGKFPFSANGRAIIHGETEGFAKLVADRNTGELLGAHVVGVQATELIAEPALARLFQGDAWEVGRNIHPHPTLSEALGEAALAVDGAALNI